MLPFADMSRENGPGLLLRRHRRGDHQRPAAASRGLRVASRTSSFQFKGAAADVREIGRQAPRRDHPRGERAQVRTTACASPSSSSTPPAASTCGRKRTTAGCEDVFAHPGGDRPQRRAGPPRHPDAPQKGPLAETPDEPRAGLRLLPASGRSYYYRYGRHDIEFALQLFSRADRARSRLLRWPTPAWPTAGPTSTSTPSARTAVRGAGRGRRPAGGRAGPRVGPGAGVALAVALSLGDANDEARAAFERAIAPRPDPVRGAGTSTPGRPSPPATCPRPPPSTRRPCASGPRTSTRPCSSAPSTTSSAARRTPGPPGARPGPGRAAHRPPPRRRPGPLHGRQRLRRPRRDRQGPRLGPLGPGRSIPTIPCSSTTWAVSTRSRGISRRPSIAWSGRRRRPPPERLSHENDGDLDPLRGHPRFKALLERM
ncbi:MAG: hypothetical protein MZV49_06240 [Rhodopseudomonas palustris]|nr:hypothetical protein [Rhodopseudomonas palustris]